MRIMHLLKHAVQGNGHVHVAVDLACAQADAGHEVTFVSARGSYNELLRQHKVEVIDIPEASGWRQAPKSARALLQVARRYRPDIIHAHMMSSAVLGFVVSKVIGATLLTTMHNSFDKHSVLMRLGKVVVAVSEAERQLLLSRGYPSRQVVTVLNGADASPREELPVHHIGSLARPCVMTLSGLHKRKAVGDVISAFAQVAPDFPQWHLNIVGSGPDREELEAMVARLGISESVHFMGSTLTPRPLLEAADIFATASLADPCPLTVTEARAAGCAIVATSVGGVPEVLDHGRAGQLMPTHDPTAMARAFRTLMADEQVLRSWQAKAKDGAEYFTVARMANDYEAVYRSVLPPKVRATTATTGRPTPVVTPTTPVPTDTARRRIRVAYFVSPSRHFAGIERVVHEIATGLVELYGEIIEVHVVFASRYDEPLLQDTRYRLHVLGVSRLRNLARRLRTFAADMDFDVFVCPQVEATVIAWFATRGLRIPHFVSHLHGNPRLEEAEATKRTKLAFALFRHLVSRRLACVIAVSPSSRDYAAGTIARHTTVYFAKNPVRELPSHRVRSPHDDRFQFVNVARLSRQKGQDILLRALALARSDLPPVTLTLVGSGPAESELRQLSAELGVEDLVVFAGYTSDPAPYFAQADCFVLPSRWEGFGIVLVEALQYGLPLLAAACEFGPADLVTDRRIGELVAAGSPDALAAGLKRAARRVGDPRDADYRREIAKSYFRGSATAMHFEIIQKLVASPNARRSGVHDAHIPVRTGVASTSG